MPSASLGRPAARVARELLGATLVRRLDGETLSLRIVETEAYVGPEDRACHAFGGRRTGRTEVMFLEGGHAYVYFVYGMHHCLNVVTGPAERGEAVLIRAGEPLQGVETMKRRRGLAERVAKPGEIAGGPARLCQALAIDRTLNGIRFGLGELDLLGGPSIPSRDIVRSPRIGVDYAGDAAAWPLRFSLRGNPHVSRPRPEAVSEPAAPRGRRAG